MSALPPKATRSLLRNGIECNDIAALDLGSFSQMGGHYAHLYCSRNNGGDFD